VTSSAARILFVAGDPSGDLYASMLMRELRRTRPGTRFEAAGGQLMRQAMGERDLFHCDLAGMGITGFVEPARKLPMLLRLLSSLKRRLALERPDAVVCVDYYGFNRRVLSVARAAGVPTFYYISPQVWASRPWRMRQLKRLVDRMIVIFPFEEPLYRKAGVPVSWVGHPLLDVLPPPRPEGEPSDRLRLGLLPGSRPSELRRHLPVFLQAASRIAKDYPAIETTVFGASSLPKRLIEPYLEAWKAPDGSPARLVYESDYCERRRQDIVLTSSGTATLENALLGLPMVVVYKLSWPTYWLARSIISVPHIAMANLLAGRRLVPELIQGDATPAKIAAAALDMLGSPRKLQALRRELAGLREKLGGPGATRRAAEALLSGIGGRGGGVRP